MLCVHYRVTRPPGGASSNIFGTDITPASKPRSNPNFQSNIFDNAEAPAARKPIPGNIVCDLILACVFIFKY